MLREGQRVPAAVFVDVPTVTLQPSREVRLGQLAGIYTYIWVFPRTKGPKDHSTFGSVSGSSTYGNFFIYI